MIHEVYELYGKEAHAEGARQGWSEQMIGDAIQRVRDERAKEENSLLIAFAEVEDREEPASTMDWHAISTTRMTATLESIGRS